MQCTEGFPDECEPDHAFDFLAGNYLAQHALNHEETTGLQQGPALIDGGKEKLDLTTAASAQKETRESDV